MNVNDLIIGTANFTTKYGFKKKLYTSSELGNIFYILKKNGIITFDTAQSYGSSEKIIGKRKEKKIIFTKFNIPNVKSSQVKNMTGKTINKSFLNLNKKKIEGILVHNSNFFIKNKSCQSRIIELLKRFKKEKKIKKIGFSIYTPNEFLKIIKIFTPDFFQIPINILDQRFLKSHIVNKIKKNKIEIHARSIFLQGKLLNDNQFYSPVVKKKINMFNRWCIKKNVDKIDACINFIRNYTFINKLVVGIDNKTQLKKIIQILKKDKYYVPTKFGINIYRLIDPRK
jgi:aryl-alcohol dehydrogenase-like predicted oxidoreductase